MTVGERFKKFRIAINKTQSCFAESCDLSRTSISLIENNINNPSFKMLCHIAHDYNLNIHWLITGEGQMFGNSSPNLKEINEQLVHPRYTEKYIRKLEQELVEVQRKLIACQTQLVELLKGQK